MFQVLALVGPGGAPAGVPQGENSVLIARSKSLERVEGLPELKIIHFVGFSK